MSQREATPVLCVLCVLRVREIKASCACQGSHLLSFIISSTQKDSLSHSSLVSCCASPQPFFSSST